MYTKRTLGVHIRVAVQYPPRLVFYRLVIGVIETEGNEQAGDSVLEGA